MIRDALLHGSSFNLIHRASMVKVDVFPVKPRPYDAIALARRRRATLGDLEVCVATPEDMVLSKLEWYATGGQLSERQWSDVTGLLRVHRDALDLAYLRRWAPELGTRELLDRALAEAGIDRGPGGRGAGQNP